MGIYNTNQQWTTYRVLDATILNADVAAGAAIDFTKLGPTGALTIGASGAGYDVTLYGDNAGSDFLWDQNGDSNIGLLSLGASGGNKGVEFIVYGATNGNSLQWDQSADDLLLVGTATQLAVAGTTDSSNPTSGSLRTAGGLGVAMAANIGTTLGIAGLITSTSVTGFRSNPTFVPDTTYTNYAFSVGNKVAELTVNFAQSTGQNFNPIQAIVNCTGTGTGPTASSQVNLFFAQLTHDTNDMANLRLKCADFSTIVGENVLDAYVFQGEIDITKSGVTVGNEACVVGLVLDAGADAVTTDGWRGLNITMRGAGTPAKSQAIFIDGALDITIREAIWICGGGITAAIRLARVDNYANAPINLLALPIAGYTPVSSLGSTGIHGGTVVKIACLVGATPYYLLASTTPSTS